MSTIHQRQRFKSFNSYSAFKNWTNDFFARSPDFLRPLNIQRTCSISWNNMHRIPSFVFESIFSELFPDVVSSVKRDQPADLKKESHSQRSVTAITLVSDQELVLCPKRINRVFKVMDTLFKINNTKFRIALPLEALDKLPRTTSSGYPDFLTPKSQNIPHISDQMWTIMTTGDSSWMDFIVPVAWRTQMRKSGIKFRQFFVFPHLVQALEMLFAKPFFDYFENVKDSIYCFGNTYTHLRTRWLFWQQFSNIISLDATAFDQSIKSKLIRLGFHWIKRHLYLTNSVQNGIFNDLIEYHCYCTVATAVDGTPTLVSKNQGIMSGTVFTNFLDTIVNAFVTLYVFDYLGLPVPEGLAVMGDDIIIPTNSSFNLKQIIHLYHTLFRIDISDEKSEIFYPGQRVYFLGYFFDNLGRYLDTNLAKRQLILSERFIPESVMSTEERVISKLCSISFKCSDGHLFFDDVIDHVMSILDLSDLPEYYTEMVTDPTGQPGVRKRILDYKLNGWIDQ